ncbi:MAG: ATP-binding protein [Polyangiales bacterium]
MTRSFASLRARAIEHLSAQHLRAASETEASHLVEELAVAYGELELQADELRITQVALERAHRHYAGLYRDAPVAFLVLDGDGEILEFNQAADAMLELRRAGASRFAELLAGDRAALATALSALPGRGRVEAEWQLRVRGASLTVRAHLAPRVEGDGALVSLIDVSALRAAELTQRRLATRLGALVQSSRDGIVVFDARTWMTLETNHAFVEMLGPPRDLVGTPLASLLTPANRAVGEQCLRQHLAAPGGLFRLTFQTADGPADLEALLSRVEDDVESTAMLVVRDDRVRRRLEDERAQLRERTLHAQKLEALGRLAAGVAHDLHNALAVITSSAETLAMGDTESLHSLRDAVERATQTTSALLAYGRAGTARRTRVDLRGLVQRTIAMLKRALPRAVTLVEDLPPHPVWMHGEEASLYQAVVNLVFNARDALQGRGLITVALRADDDTATLTVSDDGPGIPPELRERVFEPFFTTKEQGKGTGLGLSLVWSTVRAHGGEARVLEAGHRGASVRLTLPLNAQPPPPLEGTGGSARDVLARKRILLVDDEEMVLQSHARLFSRLGAEVHAVSNIRDALELAGAVDLVISDYQLGAQSGLDLLAAIRETLRTLPFLLVSGYLDEDGERALRTTPCTGFLQKPFHAQEAAAAVEQLLNATASRAP